MIYNRNTYETKNLVKEDFINGLGFNSSLLTQLRKIKNFTDSNEFDFYHEDSVGIDGKLRVKKFHPLLNSILIDNREDENGRELIIESVHKHWYNGYYWIAIYRILGTKSHGICFFKNVNCIDKTIIEAINETIQFVNFKDININWKQF